jgi:TonB family protein
MVVLALLAQALTGQQPAAEPPPAAPPLTMYFSQDDYPAAAIRAGEEGTVGFLLRVSPEGRVSDCVIVVSSGSATLDQATCRILRARARYSPAAGAGRANTGSDGDSIAWRLPPAPPPLPPGATPALPRALVPARPLWTGPLFRNRDFPRDAEHDGARGTVLYQFIINFEGRVSYCWIVQSSGWRRLDETVCRLVQELARYAPGRDSFGNPADDSGVDQVSFPLPG